MIWLALVVGSFLVAVLLAIALAFIVGFLEPGGVLDKFDDFLNRAADAGERTRRRLGGGR